MLNKVNYSSSTKHYKFALQKFKRSIFKRLSKNSVNYFLRGQDKISIEPSVNGVYEPDITELISYFNEIGYCDFLFDIGANIGLTSCQNGLAFDKVFCFGVLQHTPDFQSSVKALISKTKPGGEVVVDFYPIKGWWTKVHAKYIFRPWTKRMSSFLRE